MDDKDLFDDAFLRKLDALVLTARRSARGSNPGKRLSSRPGSGIEFADYRDYVPGDDLRYVDWSVLARHDELLIKRFREDENLSVVFFLDVSRSMSFGEPSKFYAARRVTAALAYLALSDWHNVSIVAFSEGVITEFPSKRGRGAFRGILQFLCDLKAHGDGTSLRDSLASWMPKAKRRGVAFVVSDLFDPSGFERGIDLFRFRRWESHVIHVLAPEDLDPGVIGERILQDGESNERRSIVITESMRLRYSECVKGFLSRVDSYAARHGQRCVRTMTSEPFEKGVLELIRCGVIQ